MTLVLCRGLDYVIAVCGKYGIKVTPLIEQKSVLL